MWECKKCHELLEDSFEVCWNCGTSKAGVEDPTFRVADQDDPTFLEQSGSQRVKEVGITAAPPATTAIYQAEENAYKFTPRQIEIIRSLASYMRIVGLVSVICGCLLVVLGLFLGLASGLLQGVVVLIIGGVTMQAASAFRHIVGSQEGHIGHLMTALSALRTLYKLQVTLLCIVLGLMFLIFGLVAISAH
jgi:hypothetical protein